MALYRKYRPASFAEVMGQEHVTEPLSVALESGRINHAYLFSGPRGCGKTSSARILARSLNCEQGPTATPCGTCQSCVALAPGGPGNLDVTELDAASHGGVDDTRDLRERAFFAPASSRYRVLIIDEAHMVTNAGFNALLKIVEEPPEHLIFVFATTEPEKVLPTIRSRTHHYPFRLLTPSAMKGLVERICRQEGVTVDPAVLPLVIRAGGGSPRDTLSVLDQLMSGAEAGGITYPRAVALLGATEASLLDDSIDAMAAGDGASLFRTVDRVIEAGHDPRRFAADLLQRLRDLIMVQSVPQAIDTGLVEAPGEQADTLRRQAELLGPATLARSADLVHEGMATMRGATSPRLLLEILCARLLLPAADDSVESLLQRVEQLERGTGIRAGGRMEDGASAAPDPGGDRADSGDASASDADGGAAARRFVRRSQLASSTDPNAPSQSPTAAPSQSPAAEPSSTGAPQPPSPAGPSPTTASPAAPPATSPPSAPADRQPIAPEQAVPAPSSPAPTPQVPPNAAPGPTPDPPATGSPPEAVAPQAPSASPPETQSQSQVQPQPQAPAAAIAPEDAGAPGSAPGSAAPPVESTPSPDTPPSPAPAPPSPSTAAAAPAGAGTIGAEDIRRVWSEIRNAVRSRTRTVEVMLAGATVAAVEGNRVDLVHDHDALARRLDQPHNATVIAESIGEVLGGEWTVSCGTAAARPAAGSPVSEGGGYGAPAPAPAPAPSPGTQPQAPGPGPGPAGGPGGPGGAGAPQPPVQAERGWERRVRQAREHGGGGADAAGGGSGGDPGYRDVPPPEEPEPEPGEPGAPPPQVSEDDMLAEARSGPQNIDHRTPEEIALQLLRDHLGARPIER